MLCRRPMMKTRSQLAAFALLTACAAQALPPCAHADPAPPKAAPLTAASFIQAAASTDALLAGKTPSDTTRGLFKTYNNTTHTYARNPDSVFAGFDLTCMAVSNSANADGSGGLRGCVTTITPLHGITNHHFGQLYVPGVVHYFLDRANTVQARKVVKAEQVGETDIEVVTFDSPLPASVQPAQLLPAAVVNRLLPPGTPLLSNNQQKRVYIVELAGLGNGEIFVQPAAAPGRSAWTTSPPAVLGDSDSPVFVLLDGRPRLLFTYHTSLSGPAISENLAAIRALVGSKYALDVATLR